jgi:hypothetical protein
MTTAPSDETARVAGDAIVRSSKQLSTASAFPARADKPLSAFACLTRSACVSKRDKPLYKHSSDTKVRSRGKSLWVPALTHRPSRLGTRPCRCTCRNIFSLPRPNLPIYIFLGSDLVFLIFFVPNFQSTLLHNTPLQTRIPPAPTMSPQPSGRVSPDFALTGHRPFAQSMLALLSSTARNCLLPHAFHVTGNIAAWRARPAR